MRLELKLKGWWDRNGICLFDRSSFMCNLGAQTVRYVLSNTPRLKESNEPKSRFTISSEELGWQVGRSLNFESVHDRFHFQSILVFQTLNFVGFRNPHMYIQTLKGGAGCTFSSGYTVQGVQCNTTELQIVRDTKYHKPFIYCIETFHPNGRMCVCFPPFGHWIPWSSCGGGLGNHHVFRTRNLKYDTPLVGTILSIQGNTRRQHTHASSGTIYICLKTILMLISQTNHEGRKKENCDFLVMM